MWTYTKILHRSHFEPDFKGEKSKLYITRVYNIFKLSYFLDASLYFKLSKTIFTL